jgi:hypothetical protein
VLRRLAQGQQALEAEWQQVPLEAPASQQQVLEPEVLAAQLQERLEHPQQPVLQVSAAQLLRPSP